MRRAVVLASPCVSTQVETYYVDFLYAFAEMKR